MVQTNASNYRVTHVANLGSAWLWAFQLENIMPKIKLPLVFKGMEHKHKAFFSHLFNLVITWARESYLIQCEVPIRDFNFHNSAIIHCISCADVNSKGQCLTLAILICCFLCVLFWDGIYLFFIYLLTSMEAISDSHQSVVVIDLRLWYNYLSLKPQLLPITITQILRQKWLGLLVTVYISH